MTITIEKTPLGYKVIVDGKQAYLEKSMNRAMKLAEKLRSKQ